MWFFFRLKTLTPPLRLRQWDDLKLLSGTSDSTKAVFPLRTILIPDYRPFQLHPRKKQEVLELLQQNRRLTIHEMTEDLSITFRARTGALSKISDLEASQRNLYREFWRLMKKKNDLKLVANFSSRQLKVRVFWRAS